MLEESLTLSVQPSRSHTTEHHNVTMIPDVNVVVRHLAYLPKVDRVTSPLWHDLLAEHLEAQILDSCPSFPFQKVHRKIKIYLPVNCLWISLNRNFFDSTERSRGSKITARRPHVCELYGKFSLGYHVNNLTSL